MLYCVKCGDPIEKDELVCDKCGYHFTILEGNPATVYMNQTPGKAPGQPQGSNMQQRPNGPQKSGMQQRPNGPQGSNMQQRPNAPQGSNMQQRPNAPQGSSMQQRPNDPQGSNMQQRPNAPQGSNMQQRPNGPQGSSMRQRPNGPQGSSMQQRLNGPVPAQAKPQKAKKKKNGLFIAAGICAGGFAAVCLCAVVFVSGFFVLNAVFNAPEDDIVLNNGSAGNGGADTTAPIVHDNMNTEPTDGYVASVIRDPFVTLKGNGEDTVTIMIYMNGSNLESDYGMATQDIREILDATLSDKVNVVIQTGGTKEWQTNAVSSSHSQRFVVENGGLTLVDDTLGQLDITDPDTLEDFINFCTANYPANRNMLIMWNHGGGAVYGFGYDENVNDYYAALTLDEMQQAIRNTGVKFEMIGFDACLMGGIETACVFCDLADYLIASEDFESGRGWEYRNWLTILGSNSSTPMEDLAKVIVDDFVKESSSTASDGILALIDLRYTKLLFQAWVNFAYASRDDLLSCNYSMQMNRSERAHIRFGLEKEPLWRDPWEALNNNNSISNDESILQEYNYAVDLMALAETLDTEEAKALKSALGMALVYCSSTSGDANMTGLSVTLPYNSREFYLEMEDIYSKCGFAQDYIDFLAEFSRVEVESYDWGQSEWGGWESYDPDNDYNWEDWDQWDELEDEDYGWDG